MCDTPVKEVCAYGDTFAGVVDGVLYVEGEAVDTARLGSRVNAVTKSDGKLYFRVDGQLCTLDNFGAPTWLGASCTGAYKVLGDYVYWIQQDGLFSEIRRSSLTNSDAIALTSEDAYIGAFDIVNEHGSDQLLYTCQEVDETMVDKGQSPFGVTVLKYDDDLQSKSVEVLEAAYNALDFTPGASNYVLATVKNTGTEPLTGVVVQACDKNGNVLGKTTLQETLPSGAITDVELYANVPASAQTINLSFTVSGSGLASETSPTTLTMQTEQDITLEPSTNGSLVVTNTSDKVVNGVKVAIRDSYEGGTLIRSVNLGTLAAGASKAVAVAESDWDASKLDNNTSRKKLYCEAEHNGTEFSLWDNSTVLIREVSAGSNDSDTTIPSTGTKPPTGTNPSTGTEPTTGTKPPSGTQPTTEAKPSADAKPGVDSSSSLTPSAKPLKSSLVSATVTVKSKVYTGKKLKPAAPVVTLGGKKLRAGTDFTYSCKGGKMVGSYTVIVKGKGAYTGVKTATFKIVPKGAKTKKAAAGKKRFTIKWKTPSKKHRKQITGYKVQWSTDKKFKKGVKFKLVKGAKKTSLKVTKLKSKKTYYVRVCSYKKIGKAYYCSPWSKAKKVKVK